MSARIRVLIDPPLPYLGVSLPDGTGALEGGGAEQPVDCELDAGTHHVTIAASETGRNDEHVVYNVAANARRTLLVYIRPHSASIETDPDNGWDQLVVMPVTNEVMRGAAPTLEQAGCDFDALGEYDWPMWNTWMVKVDEDDTSAAPNFMVLSGIRSWPFAWFGNVQTGELFFLDELGDLPAPGAWAP